MRASSLDTPKKPLEKSPSPFTRKQNNYKTEEHSFSEIRYYTINNDHEGEHRPQYPVSDHISQASRILHQNLGVITLKGAEYAEGHSKCSCRACLIEKSTKRGYRLRNPKFNQTSSFFLNYDFTQDALNKEVEKDFVFVVKRLIPPKALPYTLRVFIPETVIFIKGEAKFIAMTEKDKRLKFIQDKESLTPSQIRKFFHEYLKNRVEELETEEKLPEPKEEKLVTQKLPNGITKLVLPQQKKIKSKDPVKSPVIRILTREVGLVKYRDDTSTIFTEMEFNNILLKRRSDNFWKKIQYLQMYQRIKSGIRTMQRIYFVYDQDKEDPLFERSRVEIRFLNGEIPKASESYIPVHKEEQFEEELLRSNANKYYLYILMKIYHFLDIMWDIKITRMGGDFIIDNFGTPWLINLSRVQYQCQEATVETEESEIALKEHITEVQGSYREEARADSMREKTINKFKIFKIAHKFMKHQPEKKDELEEEKEFLRETVKTFQADNSIFNRRAASPILPTNRKNLFNSTRSREDKQIDFPMTSIYRKSKKPYKIPNLKRGYSLCGEDYVGKDIDFEADRKSRKMLNLSQADQSGRVSPLRNEFKFTYNFDFFYGKTEDDKSRKHFERGKSFIQTLTTSKANSNGKQRTESPDGGNKLKRLEFIGNNFMDERNVPTSDWVHTVNKKIKQKIEGKIKK